MNTTYNNENRKRFKDVKKGDYVYHITKNKDGVYELHRVNVIDVRDTVTEKGILTDIVTANAIMLCLSTDELRNGSVYGRNGESTYYADEQEVAFAANNIVKSEKFISLL